MRSLGLSFTALLLTVAVFTSGTGRAAEEITAEQVKAAIHEHIAQKVKEGGGVFKFKDERSGEEVALEFVRIRVIRGIKGHGYFADVDFRVQGEPEKLYDLDFWVKPKEGRLVLMDIRTHRYPKKEGTEWVQVTTSPLPWWWAVAQEHPGETEEKKGWEVKAAIHDHIAQKLNEGGGVYRIKDDKTGQDLELEFVTIHNPVRKVKGEGYFACTDFRVRGEPEKLYDLDFWLNEKGDRLAVTEIRIHKEPEKEGASWVKKLRYTFDEGKIVEIP